MARTKRNKLIADVKRNAARLADVRTALGQIGFSVDDPYLSDALGKVATAQELLDAAARKFERRGTDYPAPEPVLTPAEVDNLRAANAAKGLDLLGFPLEAPKPALLIKVGDLVTGDTPNGMIVGTVREIYSRPGEAYLRATVDAAGWGMPLTVPLAILEPAAAAGGGPVTGGLK